MKKLVLIFVLAFGINNSEIKSQSIIVPTGDVIVDAIDSKATDIVLENKTTGEVQEFDTATELYSNASDLSDGRYVAKYRVNNERNKVKFKIDNN